jgi:cell division protein ZapE
VTLVATSNCIPDTLYRNGLQRERFTPTIALLKENCQVIPVDGECDHRLADYLESDNKSKAHRDYFYPSAQMNDKLMLTFEQHSQQGSYCNGDNNKGSLNVYGRAIEYLAISSKTIFFDFNSLCSGPRSQRDYIFIANQFSVVFLSDVPQFNGKLVPAVFSGVEDSYQRSGILMGDLIERDDEARRFIALVDELYDRKVRLIISAAVDIDELYQGKQLSFEFARCRSRLYEMQTMT